MGRYKTQTLTTHVFDGDGFIKYQDIQVVTDEDYKALRENLGPDSLLLVLRRLGLTQRLGLNDRRVESNDISVEERHKKHPRRK